jgi:transcription termination factor Rho
LYSRGNGLLKEEKSLEEIHEIREKLSKMDEKEKEELLKKIRNKYKNLFE